MIAPPAAVANAIADALSPFGVVRINEISLTPERVLAAIERGRILLNYRRGTPDSVR